MFECFERPVIYEGRVDGCVELDSRPYRRRTAHVECRRGVSHFRMSTRIVRLGEAYSRTCLLKLRGTGMRLDLPQAVKKVMQVCVLISKADLPLPHDDVGI